ncbi:MAG TPA: DUF5009 domain-containing protein [Bacteroides sp.]|nr:DUF5009 domain-containing protein [Bacteroides sp.]
MNNNTSSRLLSLDFFRGFTMFLLIIEFTHLFNFLTAANFEGTFIYGLGTQFHHHPWAGLRFWDLIQPFFMFIVGVAMPFSYANRIKKGDSHGAILKHILIRCFLLLFLGWWLFCQRLGIIVFNFQNVLSQLSVTILISFLIMRKPAWFQLAFSLALILGMEIIYRMFWVDGFNQPFVADKNFGAWFDLLISGNLSKGHWVSINAISTTAHTIWGVLAGQLLMSSKTQKRKLITLILAGTIALAIGYGLNPVTPIIKRISTSSFVFASGGWTLLALALSYYLIDVLKMRRGVKFFAIVGMNPLFIYLFAHMGGATMINSILKPLPATFFGWAGEVWVGMITASLASFALWLICYWLYKRKIFIKI